MASLTSVVSRLAKKDSTGLFSKTFVVMDSLRDEESGKIGININYSKFFRSGTAFSQVLATHFTLHYKMSVRDATKRL